MNSEQQQSKNYIHWSKDPVRHAAGMFKRKTTIAENYTKEDITKRRSQATTNGYRSSFALLENLTTYTKDEFLTKMQSIDVTAFYGKSGNRKLIKYDPMLYKSLLYYTDFLSQYTKKIYFVLRLKIACNNLIINREMLCLCGKQISFDKQTQDFTKDFCGGCKPAPNSKKWFQHFHGDMWEEKYLAYRNNPIVIEQCKRSGRKSFAVRVGNLFAGSLAKGKNEEQILNFIERVNNIKIERGCNIEGYWPDGYCRDNNTVYEVYEQYHKYESQKEYDLKRQQEIMKSLNCNFVIIHNNTKIPLHLDELQIEHYQYV